MSDVPSGAVREWAFPNRATPAGSSSYYSIRFAPPAQRDLLAAWFAWRGELRAVLERVTDPGVARLKLDWWRDEAARLRAGNPRHPLALALARARDAAAGAAPTGDQPALPEAPLYDLIQAVEDQLRALPLADTAAWTQASERDRGGLLQLCCADLGIRDDTVRRAARRIGGWCARVRHLRDAGLLLRQGRAVLPDDRLRVAGLGSAALAEPGQRHRLPALLAPLAETLRREQPDRAELAALPAVVRIQARIHAALLDELTASGLAVVDQRIGLTPLRKFWIGWRAR